jgi:hypothetical protein
MLVSLAYTQYGHLNLYVHVTNDHQFVQITINSCIVS